VNLVTRRTVHAHDGVVTVDVGRGGATVSASRRRGGDWENEPSTNEDVPVDRGKPSWCICAGGGGEPSVGVWRSCAHNSCLQRFRERRRKSIGSCSVKAAAQHPLCARLLREKCWEEFVRSDGCRDEAIPQWSAKTVRATVNANTSRIEVSDAETRRMAKKRRRDDRVRQGDEARAAR
jgi:hypothetical protein